METVAHRSRDPEQVAALNAICARQSCIQFKRELSETKRLERMLNQVYQLATAYSPVISISGSGRKKLRIMRQLAELVSNTCKNVTHRKRELILSLKILQQADKRYQQETGHVFAPGFFLWQKRSRANRGYKAILVKITSLLDNYSTPDFWPKKLGPGDIDHFAIAGMDRCIMARQHRLFKKRGGLRAQIERKQPPKALTPTLVCSRV